MLMKGTVAVVVVVVVVFINSAHLGTLPRAVKSYKCISEMVDTSTTLFTT